MLSCYWVVQVEIVLGAFLTPECGLGFGIIVRVLTVPAVIYYSYPGFQVFKCSVGTTFFFVGKIGVTDALHMSTETTHVGHGSIKQTFVIVKQYLDRLGQSNTLLLHR